MPFENGAYVEHPQQPTGARHTGPRHAISGGLVMPGRACIAHGGRRYVPHPPPPPPAIHHRWALSEAT